MVGINTSIADRGSGMRCLVNQSSILVGMVSSEVKGNDATSYTILLYVQPYIAWINGIMVTKNPKRVSEKGTFWHRLSGFLILIRSSFAQNVNGLEV